jgi:hypothetical protein
MVGNYVNRLGSVCGTETDHPTLPEAELWTQVILQALTDLDGRTSLTPHSAKDSAREWFASESDGVCSFVWACQIINVDPTFIRSQLARKLRVKSSVEVTASMAQGAKALRRKNSPVSDNLGRAEGVPTFKRLAV